MLDLSKDISAILYDLISIESITNNEQNLSKAIETALSNLNISPIFSSNSNLVYFYDKNKNTFIKTKDTENTTNKKNEKKQSIALVGHLDTVSPFISPRLENNTIFGRGAVDMKAGLSVMLKIMYELTQRYNLTQKKDKNLKNIQKNNEKLKSFKSKYNLFFIFYTKEEGPMPNGLTEILDKNIINKNQILETIILEPTSDSVAVGCLGTVSYRIYIHGKSTHSANPKESDNAIYKSIKLIKHIKKYNKKLIQKSYKNSCPTINITQINTNNPKNVIPDTLELTINYRFTPNTDINKDTAIDYFEKTILEDFDTSIDDINKYYDFELIDFAPSVDNKRTDININKTQNIFQAWGDIAQFAKYGIHSILWGPGNLELAHQENEHITIKDLNIFYSDISKTL